MAVNYLACFAARFGSLANNGVVLVFWKEWCGDRLEAFGVTRVTYKDTHSWKKDSML